MKQKKENKIVCKEKVLYEVDGVYREVESISLKTIDEYTYLQIFLKEVKK